MTPKTFHITSAKLVGTFLNEEAGVMKAERLINFIQEKQTFMLEVCIKIELYQIVHIMLE